MLQANCYSQYNPMAEQWRDRCISKNYSTIYLQLLSDDTYVDPKTKQLRVPCKKPFYIGNKDVYALSDIEGNNITFLNFLQNLNLVQYTTDCQRVNEGWFSCHTKGSPNTVWYKFNKQACENFKDVIVLCGDYIGHDDSPGGEYSRGTVKILTQLNNLLNNVQVNEGDKRLFLVAGNHDIFFHPDDKGLSEMKKEILELGLYPQLLLKNANGEKLLFQHTNFPYREKKNAICNKQIDKNKAEKFIKGEQQNEVQYKMNNMHHFFYLRSEIDDTGKIIYCNCDADKTQLKQELFTDHGIGYDAKFVGHDDQQYGYLTKHNLGGVLINCHSYNKNKEFAHWSCGKKNPLINNAKKITYFTKPNLTLNQQRNEKYFNLLNNLDQLFSNIVKNKNIRNEFCKGICNELLNKKYL